LPLGAESVGDLVGATVSVSDADGNVVLATEIVDLSVHNLGRDGLAGGGGGDDDDDDDTKDGSGDTKDGGDGAAAGVAPEENLADEALLVLGPHDATFIRGDANMDGSLNIADPISILALLFPGGSAPYCRDAADGNDDGQVDVSDPISILDSLFLSGRGLPRPGDDGVARFDRTADALYCTTSTATGV